MNSSSFEPLSSTLEKEYKIRFSPSHLYRRMVWKILIEDFFQPLIGEQKVILDLGSGWGGVYFFYSSPKKNCNVA